jgi:hypothetical protein
MIVSVMKLRLVCELTYPAEEHIGCDAESDRAEQSYFIRKRGHNNSHEKEKATFFTHGKVRYVYIEAESWKRSGQKDV